MVKAKSDRSRKVSLIKTVMSRLTLVEMAVAGTTMLLTKLLRFECFSAPRVSYETPDLRFSLCEILQCRTDTTCGLLFYYHPVQFNYSENNTDIQLQFVIVN